MPGSLPDAGLLLWLLSRADEPGAERTAFSLDVLARYVCNGLDEFGVPRAFVQLGTTGSDDELWQAMDVAADDTALALTGGAAYELQTPMAFTTTTATPGAARPASPLRPASSASRRTPATWPFGTSCSPRYPEGVERQPEN